MHIVLLVILSYLTSDCSRVIRLIYLVQRKGKAKIVYYQVLLVAMANSVQGGDSQTVRQSSAYLSGIYTKICTRVKIFLFEFM